MNKLTFSKVNTPTIHVDKNPPKEESVFARPKIVPEKLGAMSNPFPRYPAVTAPFNVNAIVKIVTDQILSYPKKYCRIIIHPGVATAAITCLISFCDNFK